MGRRISAASFFLRGGAPAFTGDSGGARGGRVVWRLALRGFGWVMEVKIPAFAGMTGGVSGMTGGVGVTGFGWVMEVKVPAFGDL